MLRTIVRDILPSMHASKGRLFLYKYERNARDRFALQNSACWMQHANYLHRSQHHLAHGSEDKTSSDSNPSSISPAEIKKKQSLLNFWSSRFLRFLDGYQKMLEKRFPGAINVYRVFVVGFKEFTIDTKNYILIKKKVIMSPTKVIELSLKEVDLYYRMPAEIQRVGPTLLISALPLANYIVFPIAYYFPKKLLSSHFWSLQQKSQFPMEFHREKLLHYRRLFRHLQLNVEDVKNDLLRTQVQEALDQLGSGRHPSIREIIQLKPLFEKDRYSLKAIHGPHVKALCRVHGIHALYLSRRRLYDRAEMIRSIDTVIHREGIINLKTDELKTACYLRGLNASNLTVREMIEYMEDWMCISQELQSQANSLLLHLPLFMSYNHSNNWALLKS